MIWSKAVRIHLAHILILILTFAAYITAIPCPGSDWICGDSFCCCNGANATCENQNLAFIPVLPKDIISLTFKGNNLRTISAETFVNISLSTIDYLDLQSNGIEHVHKDTFINFTKLQTLSLQNNNKLNWNEFKVALCGISHSLRNIILDNTGLATLSRDIFDGLRHKNIWQLSLKNNSIKVFNEENFYFLTCKTLDLSYNKITTISNNNGSRLGHRTVENLVLSHNKFVKWPPRFCKNDKSTLYPQLKSLDLSGNKIINLVSQAWSCLKTLEKLNLRKNAIDIFKNDSFKDLTSLQELQISNMPKQIERIEAKAFHNTNMFHLHFDNNKIKFRPNSTIPYDLLFTFCPNVSKLLIGYNNMKRINDNKLITMLSPLVKLTELSMEKAHLYKLPQNLFYNFPNLTKLDLSKNEIKEINPIAFKNVTKLEILYLDGNKIKVINDTFPETLQKTLKEVNFAGNPFSCSFCESNNNAWFINWINEGKVHLKENQSFYECDSPESERGSCLMSHKPNPEDCKTANPMVVAYATIGAFLLVFAVSAMICYRGRWYIRYWTIKYSKKCIPKATDPERQNLLGFIYDAYVIYHENERNFVRGEILKFMEEKNNYNLFIWDRDFIAGDQTVAVFVDNLYKSSHVIAVVSKSFLKDQWCDFQLAVSLDRQIELKTNFITLITTEDIDKKLLSKTWCVLLTKTPNAEWCGRKNDIRRKLFEQEILSNVPCKSACRSLRKQTSINCDTNE